LTCVHCNYNDNGVAVPIGATGALTPLGTAAVMTGTHPNGVTISSLNKHAYVANFGANTVSQYNIGTTGGLTPMSTPTVATGSFPASIVISPDGKYAYVANYAWLSRVLVSGAPVDSGQDRADFVAMIDGTEPSTVNTGSASQPNSLIVDPTNHSFSWPMPVTIPCRSSPSEHRSTDARGFSGAYRRHGPVSITVDPSGHRSTIYRE
jgi:6-phosphogluconolactonase (cycloisomerase 2 family)